MPASSSSPTCTSLPLPPPPLPGACPATLPRLSLSSDFRFGRPARPSVRAAGRTLCRSGRRPRFATVATRSWPRLPRRRYPASCITTHAVHRPLLGPGQSRSQRGSRAKVDRLVYISYERGAISEAEAEVRLRTSEGRNTETGAHRSGVNGRSNMETNERKRVATERDQSRKHPKDSGKQLARIQSASEWTYGVAWHAGPPAHEPFKRSRPGSDPRRCGS